jgi:hypothetical protein
MDQWGEFFTADDTDTADFRDSLSPLVIRVIGFIRGQLRFRCASAHTVLFAVKKTHGM